MSRDAAALGALLIAHGARDPAWARPFDDMVRQIATLRPGAEVCIAYLEFMEPSIADAGRALAERGCTRVLVMPLFLGAGGHVRKDIPGAVERLRQEFSHIEWTLDPAIGELDSIIAAMARAAAERLDEIHRSAAR